MSLGLRHAAKRRKARLSGFPTRSSMIKTAFDVLIYPIAILAPLALLPQVMLLYATRDASGLSLPTWVLLACINVIWIGYGVVHKEKPVVVNSLILVVLNSSVAVGILLFR